jgi:signal transduction histidine kinase
VIQRLRRTDPFVVDGLLALLCALVTIVTVALTDSPALELDAVGVTLLLAQTLPVAWRRQRPALVWLIVGCATAIYGIGDFPDTVLDLGPPLAVYTIAAWCRRRTATIIGLATAVAITAALISSGDADARDVSFNLLLYALAWILGEVQRARRAAVDDLARRAVTDERARIASELHDVVAHHVSMMVVHAEGGASVAPADPERAVQAFDAISTTGRQAMSEMRRILGVLKDEGSDGALVPQPGLATVGDLVEGVRRSGLEVDFQLEGRARPLPPGLDLSAYRIVQEALTNAVRHADARRLTVAVRYDDEAVELEVADDGHGPAPDLGASGGHGLVGRRERVALYGGELRVGTREGGGFAVVARLPTGTAFGHAAGTGFGQEDGS